MEKKLYDALMALNTSSKENSKVLRSINKKFSGVEAAKSEDYDVIRKMILSLYGEEFYKRK
jgi:ABC-type phosphate/phosphonate transport system substrate-binding protein